MATTHLGQIAYEVYGGVTGGLNYLGKPMPEWDDLPEQIRLAWGTTAQAAANAMQQIVSTANKLGQMTDAELIDGVAGGLGGPQWPST
jgi:hypothetical protein